MNKPAKFRCTMCYKPLKGFGLNLVDGKPLTDDKTPHMAVGPECWRKIKENDRAQGLV